MIGFRRGRDTIDARLTSAEAALLYDLTSQLILMLEDRAAEGDRESPLAELGIEVGPDAASADPALARLLPSAHEGDDEASAEFRRLTEPGLVHRKLHNAAVVRSAVTSEGGVVSVQLDAEAVQSWLRTLTDIRLVIASRLDILLDDDSPESDDPHDQGLYAAYEWLGWVQGSLIAAMEG